MSEFPLPADKLKKIVLFSKKAPVGFAFNPGANKDSHFLAVHRKKNPEMLGKLARKEGTGAKVAFGTMQLEGKVVSLMVDKLLPRLAKVFKQYLKANSINKNVQILDADGYILDSDVEDLPDEIEEDVSFDDDGDDDGDDDSRADAESAEAAPDAPTPTAPDITALKAKLKALQGPVSTAPPPVGPKLVGAFKGAVASLQAGDLEKVAQVIAQIEAVLAKLAATPTAATPPAPGTDVPQTPAAVAPDADADAAAPGPDPRLAKVQQALDGLRAQAQTLAPGAADPLLETLDELAETLAAGQVDAALAGLRDVQTDLKDQLAAKAKWDAAYVRVAPLVEKALAGWPPKGAAALRVKWQFAISLADEDGLYERATASLAGVVALLKTPPAAAAEDGTPPEGGVAFQTSRVMWLDARSSLMAEVQKLADNIVAQSADDEDSSDIKAATAEIVQDAARIDTRLQNALDAVTAASGETREKLKREAAAVLAEYQAILATGVFAIIDNNPFSPMTTVADAKSALSTIARTLA
jgi:hypothetical protein